MEKLVKQGELSKLYSEYKTAVWQISMAVFLTLTNPTIWLSSDFWNQVLQNSVRLAKNEKWGLCNISNIVIDWVKYTLTAEHCSNRFDWKNFHNGDLRIWKSRTNWKNYNPLEYDTNTTNENLYQKKVKLIWKLPFFDNDENLYTINIEFDVLITWIFRLWENSYKWNLIWIIEISDLEKKINEYFKSRWEDINYSSISKFKKSIFNWLSWSPLFYNWKVVGVFSKGINEKDLQILITYFKNSNHERYSFVFITWPDILHSTINSIEWRK